MHVHPRVPWEVLQGALSCWVLRTKLQEQVRINGKKSPLIIPNHSPGHQNRRVVSWFGSFYSSLYCDRRCGHCKGQQPCKVTEGRCVTCDRGWNGTRCDQLCSKGFFGENCQEVCPTCKDGHHCDPIHGKCSHCNPGWIGDRYAVVGSAEPFDPPRLCFAGPAAAPLTSSYRNAVSHAVIMFDSHRCA